MTEQPTIITANDLGRYLQVRWPEVMPGLPAEDWADFIGRHPKLSPQDWAGIMIRIERNARPIRVSACGPRMPTLPFRCGDCGAKLGHYHHRGCDVEQCANCKGQFLTCRGVVCERVSKPLWWVKN